MFRLLLYVSHNTKRPALLSGPNHRFFKSSVIQILSTCMLVFSPINCLLQNPYHVRQGDSVRQSSSWGLFRQSQKPINQKIWNDHSRQEVHQLTGLSEAHPHCRSLSNTVSKFYDPITGHLITKFFFNILSLGSNHVTKTIRLAHWEHTSI